MDLLTIEKKRFTEPEGRSEWQEFTGGICNERKFTMGWICIGKKCTMGRQIFLLTCIFNCSHLNFSLLNNLLWILCILIVLSDAIHYRDFFKIFMTATCYITP